MATSLLSPRTLRARIAGTDGASTAAKARARRWDLFLSHIPDLRRLHVVDLGGTAAFWAQAPTQPAALTIVNLDVADGNPSGDIEIVAGDACDAARILGGREFDLVFSNSTIEHLGGHDRCLAFARNVSALAARHWVQTPYRYFPVEPHYVFPGLQFLPAALRARAVAMWPLSYTKAQGGEIDDPTGTVLSTVLLSTTELAYYFPHSEIVAERWMGLTKSIIAVRS